MNIVNSPNTDKVLHISNMSNSPSNNSESTNPTGIDSPTEKTPEELSAINLASEEPDSINVDDIVEDPAVTVSQGYDIKDTLTLVANSADITSKNKEEKSQTLDITPEIKVGFINSLVSGDRFEQTYTLLNGKLSVTFRTRSSEEDRAILKHLAHLERTEKIQSNHDYTDMLRLCLLAAHVKELNGVQFGPLEAPLFYTVSGVDVVSPAWIKQLDYWAKRPPALVSVLISQLRIFERIYWTLTSKVSDINFWKTGESF